MLVLKGKTNEELWVLFTHHAHIAAMISEQMRFNKREANSAAQGLPSQETTYEQESAFDSCEDVLYHIQKDKVSGIRNLSKE